jgi:hypothetical protein
LQGICQEKGEGDLRVRVKGLEVRREGCSRIWEGNELWIEPQNCMWSDGIGVWNLKNLGLW